MNELQVKTIELTPAVVEFNFDELSSVLDEQLKKYEGLEFTEKDVKECKKTIAELNKGKKSLNDYRLKTKKELSIEITDFEAKCKNLSSKFDEVIKPLKDQSDQFEENRKNEKREKIKTIVDELLEKKGLNDKYAAELVIEDSYLTKSKTIKSIKEELTTKAEHLGIKQDKEEGDKEVIKDHLQLINKMCSTSLPKEPYIRLLEFKDVAEIKSQIEDDSEKEVEKWATKQEDEPKVVPLSSAPASISDDEKTYVEVYTVTATDDQLEALEDYMSNQSMAWSVIEE